MNRCLIGDCREVLPTLPERSVDAVVTDPPYGLSFMGRDWDHGVPGEHFWREVIRTMKPGAHLLAFGGTRTFHRLTCAIEDAGFEIRDCIMWLYGSGFPKSLNLDGGWKGWGTALKPAWEPIILARKPLDGTVAENVQRHGTGALNIDGCRIEYFNAEDKKAAAVAAVEKRASLVNRNFDVWRSMKPQELTVEDYMNGSAGLGRWPANVIHDGSDEVLDEFAKFGEYPGVRIEKPCPAPEITGHKWGTLQGNRGPRGYADTGSAARFFYCAKASKSDRDEGLEHVPEKLFGMSGGAAAAARGERYDNGDSGMNKTTLRRNNHPTVKPTTLMRYLCRLVTPPGGVVLDPFMGSGSTGKAAALEGFKFIGIEQQAEYLAIAEARILHAKRLRDERTAQHGLAL